MTNRTYHSRGVLVDGFKVREHPLYYTWADMLSRCTNPYGCGFSNYGGRGISVCARWHHFRNFAADMGLKPDGDLTLERADNDKGYEPGNCIWATRTDQCVNRRTFQNNTSGHTGVVQVGERFEARFDYNKARYRLGRYWSREAAAAVRDSFVDLFFVTKVAALDLIPKETIWCTSVTGVRGVTPHKDGGFTARTTIKGERKYLGLFPSVEAAASAIKEARA